MVGAVNDQASQPTAPERESTVPKCSTDSSGPAEGAEHQRVHVDPNKGEAKLSDSPQQPSYEAILEARTAQLEAKIMSQGQTILEKTIETCVRTIMEKLLLTGMFPLGAPPTLATTLTGAIPVASSNVSSPQQTHGPASFVQ